MYNGPRAVIFLVTLIRCHWWCRMSMGLLKKNGDKVPVILEIWLRSKHSFLFLPSNERLWVNYLAIVDSSQNNASSLHWSMVNVYFMKLKYTQVACQCFPSFLENLALEMTWMCISYRETLPALVDLLLATVSANSTKVEKSSLLWCLWAGYGTNDTANT